MQFHITVLFLLHSTVHKQDQKEKKEAAADRRKKQVVVAASTTVDTSEDPLNPTALSTASHSTAAPEADAAGNEQMEVESGEGEAVIQPAS